MTYSVKIIADSIAMGVRLTSMEVTFPRFILAEFNTHRVFSRNSASSRAIPVERRLAQVRDNPFMPEAFGKNRRGMQAAESLDEMSLGEARLEWYLARDAAVESAERLMKIGVHKQHANRLLEPFCWHTVLVTATEWDNFFALRTHEAAQPEMQIIAKMMKEAFDRGDPLDLDEGEWHLPYVDHIWLDADGEPWDHKERALPIEQQLALSTSRCAAVSYERQNSDKPISEAIKRHDDLLAAGHMSPFEHQAKVDGKAFGVCDQWAGNFRKPWLQYRKMLRGESVWVPR